jgi:hypothetical protein
VTLLASCPAELVIAARLLGAGVFILSIYGKLRNWVPFVGIVANYRLLPAGAARVAAVVIIAAEALVVGSFGTGVAQAFGGMLGIALLLGFALAMAIALARGDRVIDCGCFQSSLRQTLGPILILRNLVLAGLLLPTLAVSQPLGGALSLIDAVGTGLTLLLLNAAVATMIAVRDANARLRERLG